MVMLSWRVSDVIGYFDYLSRLQANTLIKAKCMFMAVVAAMLGANNLDDHSTQ